MVWESWVDKAGVNVPSLVQLSSLEKVQQS